MGELTDESLDFLDCNYARKRCILRRVMYERVSGLKDCRGEGNQAGTSDSMYSIEMILAHKVSGNKQTDKQTGR